MKKIKAFYDKLDKNILIILVMAIAILSPLLSGFYMKGHDTFYHFSNITALSENIDISNGKFFPDKVVPLITNDFGWGEGIFYPSLPHYFSVYVYKVFANVGFELLTVMNMIHILVLFGSGLSIYYLVKKKSRNSLAGLTSSIIYMTFPYLFMDIGVRDAYAETFLFLFVPLIFLGLEYLFEKNYKKFYIYFIIGYVGSLNCHLVLSVYLTIFVILFLLLHLKSIWNRKDIIALFIAAFLILGFSAPFVLPMLEHTIFGSYTVYSKDFMWNIDTILSTRVGLLDYLSISLKQGYVYMTISFIGLLCFCLVFVNKNKFDGKVKEGFLSYIWLAIIVFVLMLPIIPWNIFPNFLLSIQLVWRLQLFLAFFISVVAGYIVILVRKSLQKSFVIVVGILSLIGVYSFYPATYLNYLDASKIDVSSTGAANYEYIPQRANVNRDYLMNRKNDIIIEKGKAEIKNVISDTPKLQFDIITKGAQIEIPRLHYFGYKVILKNDKGTKILNYSENDNGFISFRIPTSGTVYITYEGTFGYKIGIILWFISLAVSIVYLFRIKRGSKE